MFSTKQVVSASVIVAVIGFSWTG